MERAAISLAVAAVSPIIAKLGGAAASYFGGDVTRDELDQLNTVILPKISTLIEQAERIDAAKLRPWLTKLQAAAYEAEDILDMYEYNTIKREVSRLPTYLKKIEGTAKEMLAPVLLKTKMKASFEKLRQSADDADALIHVLNLVNSTASQEANTTARQPQRTTVSGMSSPVFGRDEERRALVNMLTAEPRESSGKRNVVLHAIHGIGGAGKTTLAQQVFNDARVQDHFNLKIWVHVSPTFDPHKITKQIIEGVKKVRSADPVGNLDVLQSKLKEALMSRRFLLVLDDLWTEDMQSLDQLLVPLHQGGKVGSRILLTTRMERTVLISRAKDENIVYLEDLTIGECRSIFKHYAFDDAEKVIEDPELADICEKAMCNLRNSPLAARLAGSLLRKTACTAGAWRRILSTDMLGETMDVIVLSFQHLPPHLQRCFAICSLYQKGHRHVSIHIDKLVRLWIAHGYVEATGHESLEDKGKQYFDDLISYSLFQSDPAMKGWYTMHDLVHDLAEKVSRNYCFRIEGDDPVSIPPTVIHLSVLSGKLNPHMANIMQLGNLRTFLLSPFVMAKFSNINKQLVTMFEKLTKLRVLHLDWYSEQINFSFVDKLKHLRYLQLSKMEDELPESLGTLYHLQYMHLYVRFMNQTVTSTLFNGVPKSLNNLVKLRRVDPDGLCSKIDDIGKLTSLQQLEVYGADRTMQYGLQQLEKLQHIRGRLTIEGLEFVKDKAGATIAMLNKKRHLETLELTWGNQRAAGVAADEAVLEGLEPHPNLKMLAIRCYNGAKPPGWMLDDRQGWLPNLTSLNLWRCPNLTSIPNLPCQLRELIVRNCPKLMQLYPFPCSLEVLEMINDPFPCSLEVSEMINGLETGALLSSDVASYDKREKQQQHLMGSSSHQPFALRSLKIRNCCLFEGHTLNDLLMNNKFPSLLNLEVEYLPLITSLLLGPHLASLKDLSIVGLENLRSVKFMGPLTSIKSLTVRECPELTTAAGAGGGEIDNGNRLPSFEGDLEIDEPLLLPVLLHEHDLNSLIQLKISMYSQDVPFSAEQEGIFFLLTSLRRLSFYSCDNLPSLPGTLEKLSSIEELAIEWCNKIKSLPHLPCSLKLLSIFKCPEIESLPNLPASLEHLWIQVCSKIESLPNLPSCLKSLRIYDCHPRLKANYKDGGPLHHEINHIRDIVIS